MNNCYRSGPNNRNVRNNCNPSPCPANDGARLSMPQVSPLLSRRGCGELSGLPIAMAYVPWQQFTDLYCEDEALYKGTIFKELRLDFAGRGCRK